MRERVLVIEKRWHIGGNIYVENMDDIEVPISGVHIFHTKQKTVWDYVNHFVFMKPFVNSFIANYRGSLLSTL